ncbi:PREDICTED: serine protease inhibitor dipetalogastin-like, partial [Nicrophorus vespilloides]|uniref:Serine protease inhibitor dipetalogastin-like n=1 Tax=Nicrophorus vespilloides TaxID=110193 RepID=A0ABM1MEF9_NICVS
CAKKTFQSIEIAYSGECGNPRETKNLDCPCTKELNPVCATNGVTYANPCLFRFCATNGVTYANPCLFRCAKKTFQSIEIAYSGECGNPRETRNLDCPCTREYRPVCATNGVTYANPCLFRCAKKTFEFIEIAYNGKC